jgi:hypothetical protein
LAADGYDPTENPRWIPTMEPELEADPLLVRYINEGQAATSLLPWATGSEWARFISEYVQRQIDELVVRAVNAQDTISLAEFRGQIAALERIRDIPNALRQQQQRGMEAQAQLSRPSQ